MEYFVKRFHKVAVQIFNNLDDSSLDKCKMMSPEMFQCLEKGKFFWIRLIKKYQKDLKDFPKSWRPVIEKTPVETVKEIAIAVSRFFTLPHLFQDAIHKFRWSLFTISVFHGNMLLIQHIILELGIKKVRKTELQTAIFLAASEGHVHVYEFLTRKLKNKNPKCSRMFWITNRKTPLALNIAAESGHVEMCKLIMDNLTDKNPEDGDGWTPLHSAARSGKLEVCELIMANLTDKNPTGGNGWTPLHAAARSGQVEICKLIMANLTDKNPANADGWTPLDMAKIYGHHEVCQLIEPHSTQTDKWHRSLSLDRGN